MYNIEQAKVTLLGDANAGKSSIIMRFISDSFQEHSDPTFGATFLTKVIDFDKKSIKLSIWDTAGQERYNSLAASYSRDSRACILVYDITNRNSFIGLNKWYTTIRDHLTPNAILVIVGNKEDMIENEDSTLFEGQEYAKSINAMYMRTSAKLGTGVKELFLEISKEILGVANLNVRDSIRTTRGISLCPQQSPMKKKGCCT